MKRFAAEAVQVGAAGIRAVDFGSALLKEEEVMFDYGKFEGLPEAESDLVSVDLNLVAGTLTIGGTQVEVHPTCNPGDWQLTAGWLDSKYRAFVSDQDALELLANCANAKGNLPAGIELVDPVEEGEV
jgi:hypothetical protein